MTHPTWFITHESESVLSNLWKTFMRNISSMKHRLNWNKIHLRTYKTHANVFPMSPFLKSFFSARTTNRFRDHSDKDRSAIHCSWHPDGGRSLAVAHANLGFQSDSSITESYVWNVENSNKPENILRPPSMALCLEYNPKDSHVILAGLHSGQVT